MNDANEVFDFYSEAAPMTAGGSHTRRLHSLPGEIKPLLRIVQNLFVYDVVAKDFYGFEVPRERGGEIHIRSTEALIDSIVELDEAPLAQARSIDKRVIGRCNHYVLLAVAALRANGTPARARFGFGAYFNRPKFEDHLVCEYWDEDRGAWLLADPLFDKTWIEKLNIRHDVTDVPRDQFLVTADAWHQCRTGKLDANDFGIEFDKLRGLWFIAASLIRDVASLNKVEMLPWDNWGAQPKPDTQLSKDQLAFFDELAELTADPDSSFGELQTRYDADERLRVPDSVYNALTKRMESVDIQVGAESAAKHRPSQPPASPTQPSR